MLTVAARHEGDVTIVDIDGEIKGGPESKQLYATVRKELDAGRSKVLMNLTNVPWINSMGLGDILSCLAACRRSEADFRMCGLNDRVSMILGISGLTPNVIDTYPDEAAARAAFAKA